MKGITSVHLDLHNPSKQRYCGCEFCFGVTFDEKENLYVVKNLAVEACHCSAEVQQEVMSTSHVVHARMKKFSRYESVSQLMAYFRTICQPYKATFYIY